MTARTMRNAGTPTRRPRLRAAVAPLELAERGGTEDRRKQILKAAVRVFALKGYHGCRISDVADEAGVAYGLVYHYYGNKDGLLAAVFDTNWAFFQRAVEDIAASTGTMFGKLKQIVELAFQAFEIAPLVVKVLVLEFGRNARLGEALDNPQVARVFSAIASIFERAQQRGEMSADVDALAMSVIFMGTLETAFVSFVLQGEGKRPSGHARLTLDSMRTTLLAILQRALVPAVLAAASSPPRGPTPAKTAKSKKLQRGA